MYVLRGVLVGLAILTVGCTRGDGTELPAALATSPTSSVAPATTSVTIASTTPITSPGASDTSLPPGPPTIAEGIPGLDSDDAFCAAWSRFGGSFNVVAPIAAFGDDAWLAEVLAAPTMVESAAAMFENWPDELADVRHQAEVISFGPLIERMTRAQQRLIDAGATDAEIVVLRDAWALFLADYNPEDPGVEIQTDGTVDEMINAAVAATESAEQPFSSDPALITDPVPEFYDYLRNCPDQGTLAGQDIAGD